MTEPYITKFLLARDTTHRVAIRWDRTWPHFRVVTDGHSMAFETERMAVLMAARQFEKFNLTLERLQ